MCAYWPSRVMPAASGTSTISATAISTRLWPACRRRRLRLRLRSRTCRVAAAKLISAHRLVDLAVLAAPVQLAAHAVDADRPAGRLHVRVRVAQVAGRAGRHL